MKQKISIALEQSLARRIRLHASQRGQALSAVFEDALRAWLDRAAAERSKLSLVVGTVGNMAIDPPVLATILNEDLCDAA